MLRPILQVCGQKGWQLTELNADDGNADRDQVTVTMTLTGVRIGNAAEVLSEVDGVSGVFSTDDEPD